MNARCLKEYYGKCKAEGILHESGKVEEGGGECPLASLTMWVSLSYAPHVAQGINLARGVGVCGASLIMGVMNQWLTKCSCRGFHYLMQFIKEEMIWNLSRLDIYY